VGVNHDGLAIFVKFAPISILSRSPNRDTRKNPRAAPLLLGRLIFRAGHTSIVHRALSAVNHMCYERVQKHSPQIARFRTESFPPLTICVKHGTAISI
jgi:hypothetical protein